MAADGTFLNYPALVEPLPPLVRKQRRLAAAIALVAPAVVDEKAVRGQIDQLLVAAGLKKSEVVTCLGYDVRHNEKAGQSSINADKLTEKLVAAGMPERLVLEILAASTETGEPAKFATVTPSKGAKVRV
jgi:hypothetical protein